MVSEMQGHITRKAPFLHSTHDDKLHWISSKVLSRSDEEAGIQTASRVVATEIVAVIVIPRLMLRDNVMF